MARTKLTKTAIAALQAPTKGAAITYDTEVRGFGVRVTAGAKTYILRYKIGTQSRFYTICRFGEFSVDEARDHARALRGRIAEGADPAAEKKAAREAETISDLIALYEKEGLIVQRGKRQGETMKPTTAAYTLARLNHHVVPLLGKRKCKDLNAGDIERWVKDITAGKTARDEKIKDPVTGRAKRIIVRGGEGAARKVARDLSAVLSFAKRRNIVPNNAVELASIRKTDNRSETFMTLDQIKALGAALNDMESEGVNSKAVNIIRLWALTGCRRNEIAGLKWAEVDFANGMLRFGDSKTGKNTRPLGAAAIQLLAGIKRDEKSPYVFPAEEGVAFYSGTKRYWPELKRRARLPDNVTPHTLRHSIGSLSASSGESLLITGALLGHANPRSTAIYAHVAQDPSKRVADRVSGQVAAALAGTQSADVVNLKR